MGRTGYFVRVRSSWGAPVLTAPVRPCLWRVLIDRYDRKLTWITDIVISFCLTRQPYLDEIFTLVREYWSNTTTMQTTILTLIEQVAVALGGDFKMYLSQLVPQILKVWLQRNLVALFIFYRSRSGECSHEGTRVLGCRNSLYVVPTPGPSVNIPLIH